jgi:hypothetical protein
MNSLRAEPNKRIQFASTACPTHKSLRALLAAYSRRWASGEEL